MVRERARRLLAIITLQTLLELVLAAGAVVGFVAIADEVVEHEADAFDASLAHALRQGLHSHTADVVLGAITSAGSVLALSIATALTALVALYRRQRWTAVILVVNALVALGLNALLKHFFARARPNLEPAIPLPATFSFPSGHAMMSFAIYATIAASFVRIASRRTSIVVIALAAVLISTIGLSRIYLGVHWPLDVLAGYVAAVPLVAVNIHLMRRFEPIASSLTARDVLGT